MKYAQELIRQRLEWSVGDQRHALLAEVITDCIEQAPFITARGEVIEFKDQLAKFITTI